MIQNSTPRFILLVLLFISSINQAFSNNLQITNVEIASINTGSQFAEIELDIAWDNSWRDANNWDAAWIFIKFREVGNTDAWLHATLNYVNGTTDGHTLPTGTTINTPSDGKGVFIYRNASGSGNVNFTDARLRWNFGVDGLATTDFVDIKVFAVEMVYVPQGAFYVGDGQNTTSQVYGNFEAGTSGAHFQITSEAAITLGGGGVGSLGNNNRENMYANDGVDPLVVDCSSDGCLGGSGDDFNDVTSQTLPAAFPKGYNAFYCMKYEMTQQQLVDLLNCSTTTQQATLSSTSNFFTSGTISGDRYGILESSGTYSTVEPFLPLIFCDWVRAAAYADWAALRPMTELEFEKACRGFDVPVINEFAWGNANIDLSNNLTLNNLSLTNEGIASGYDSGGTNGNAWVGAGSQVMPYIARGGIFAAHPNNSGRVTSGASVWGIMDLSGNAWERAISVGHVEGRKFIGTHGDGNINNDGYADIATWAGTFASSIVDTNVGVGYRGGALEYPNPNLERNARVSSRRLASGYWNTVIKDDGARFVRSAN